jgi:hypothetical protein
VTSIRQLTSLYQEREPSKLYSPQRMEEKNKYTRSMISQEEDALWACIILMNQSLILHTNVSSSHFWETTPCIFQPKTQFLKNMTEDSKIFSKPSMIKNTKNNSKKKKSGMNTDLLMIWWLIWLNLMEDLFGLAKITMETSNLIA